MKNWFLLFASVAFSVNAATLIPEHGVSVLYVNGVATEKSIGYQHLDAGDTEVIVRLDKDFGRGSSSKVFTSAPYVVKFSVSGEEVKLEHPTARSYQEAENAFRSGQPQWKITQNGREISYKQELLPPNEGLLFPYAGLEKLVANYYSVVDNREIKELAVKASTVPEKNSSNLMQLKAWYLQSSTEERKAFRRWMIDQE